MSSQTNHGETKTGIFLFFSPPILLCRSVCSFIYKYIEDLFIDRNPLYSFFHFRRPRRKRLLQLLLGIDGNVAIKGICL